MTRHRLRRPIGRTASRQHGVVMLFALITLVVMLIAAVAMARSFNSALFTAGNIGFKRDLQNESEQAVAVAMTAFRTGGPLSTSERRKSNLPANNYSATMLPSNAQGIPTALVDASFGTAPNLTFAGGTMRYLIDRLCSTTGNETSLTPADCVLSNTPRPTGGGWMTMQNADSQKLAPASSLTYSSSKQAVTFRLSVMVTGPRNTQSFFQSTITIPSLP